MKPRPVKTYCVRHPVRLTLQWEHYYGPKIMRERSDLTLEAIESSDPEENRQLGDTGEYWCCDNEVFFVHGGLRVVGGNCPGAGSSYDVELLISQDLLAALEIIGWER